MADDVGGGEVRPIAHRMAVAYDRDGAIIPDPDNEPARPVAKTRSHFQTGSTRWDRMARLAWLAH